MAYLKKLYCLRNVAADFLNLKKGSFLAFQQRGDPMKIFWKASILEMAESDIFYVKGGADDDAAIEK